MFYNRQLLERIGNRWMIAGGLLISTAKLALFAALAGRNAIAAIVIAQIALGGVGFALMISGVVNLIDRRAHEDLRATYQNLYHLIFTLGYAFSGLFASFVIKHLGSRWLMGIDGAILLAAVIYFLVVVRGHGPLLTDADYKSRPSSG
jgi:predicted MFS family arabinose efflux permease